MGQKRRRSHLYQLYSGVCSSIISNLVLCFCYWSMKCFRLWGIPCPGISITALCGTENILLRVCLELFWKYNLLTCSRYCEFMTTQRKFCMLARMVSANSWFMNGLVSTYRVNLGLTYIYIYIDVDSWDQKNNNNNNDVHSESVFSIMFSDSVCLKRHRMLKIHGKF